MKRDPGAPDREPSPSVRDDFDPAVRARRALYWRRNKRYLAALLTVWCLVSFGLGIVLAEPLNRFTLPGTAFPLGFWFAQQGSIYAFVVLIFVYVWLMNRLDREFDVDEPGGRPARGGTRGHA
jgi:putative solute:sodium symporter small subunit